MNILGILSLLATLVGAGANISKGQKQAAYKKNLTDQEKSAEDVSRANEKTSQDEQRRSAMSRILGSKQGYMDSYKPLPPPNVYAPDTGAEDMTAGISGAAGAAANQLSTTDGYKKWLNGQNQTAPVGTSIPQYYDNYRGA